MFRTRRVLTSLCLLPLLACGEDDPSTGSADSFSSLSTSDTSETATDTAADTESGTASNDGGSTDTSTGDDTTGGDGDDSTGGDGDDTTGGDGDDTTGGDGDSGDGDTTTTTSGDGDSGDGDTSSTTSGDGDSSSTTTGGDGDGDGDGDSGTDTTTTSTSTTGGDGDGDACFELPFTVEPLTPNVVLVLDKSKSMFSNEISQNVTRWAQLHDTVTNITTDFDGAVNFGSVLYPSTDASASGIGACAVNDGASIVPIAELNGTNVVMSMPAPGTPSSDPLANGGTPAHDGLVKAYDALDAAISQFPDNPAFVILITDGAANCDTSKTVSDESCHGYNNDLFRTYDQRLLPLVLNEKMVNEIDTYVVGIGMVESEATCPGQAGATLQLCSDPWRDEFSDCWDEATYASGSIVVPWDRLNELADAGGVPQTIQMAGDSKFYNANNPQALNDALNDILGQLTSCELELTFSPPNPENPNSVEVYVEDPNNPGQQVLVPQADCSQPGQNGWWYPNAPTSYQEIELCGTFCDTLLATGQAEIDFFCDAG